MGPKLLTLPEAIERFHAAGLTDLTVGWISKQIDAGSMPAVVVARKRRVREDVVDRKIAGWMKGAA